MLYSELSGRFFASNRYRDLGNGLFVITGKKYDVTQDIAGIIVERGIKFSVDKSKSKYRAGKRRARK